MLWLDIGLRVEPGANTKGCSERLRSFKYRWSTLLGDSHPDALLHRGCQYGLQTVSAQRALFWALPPLATLQFQRCHLRRRYH